MKSRNSRLRILVLGHVIRGPVGGLSWHYLQYVLGLSKLGHDVYFLEDSDDYESCFDPRTCRFGTDPSYGLRYAEKVFGRLGLAERWAYFDAHKNGWMGPATERVRELIQSADMLINVSGVNPIRDWFAQIPIKVLIDTDPAFTQVKHLSDSSTLQRIAACHTHFFTFAANFGLESCTVPDDGLPWLPTRQPVVLEAWVQSPPPSNGSFTTVMQWESYESVNYGGRRMATKAASFPPYFQLPSLVNERLEIALGGSSAPRELLNGYGWHLVDPIAVSEDPWSFQTYLGRSKAEFGIAKAAYVETKSGWFSERSTSYLASGRPVVVQDTGFTRWLNAGVGVVAFSDPDEARAAIEDVSMRYAEHCSASVELCRQYFEYGLVLERLIEEVWAGR